MNPVLSILIISHNQREQLRRCVESVLAQDLPFEHEIIISDDASTDGTWELIQDYVTKYPDLIQGYQVNSDDCNPTSTSERSGHNRSNAYSHATGKYFVHVDGDDYLKGTDCYKRQVEQLEIHPDCSMCMQNILCVRDGEILDTGRPVHASHKFFDGQILTPQDFFLKHYFIFHSAFVFRRQVNFNPAELYHKFYVDDIITFHHLQFGPIVCIDCCDYVYVNYPKSITSSLDVYERSVIWTLDLTVTCALLIPRFTGLYYAGELDSLLSSVNKIRKGFVFSTKTKNNFRQFDAFIYQVCVKNSLSCWDKIRLQAIKFWLIVLLKTHNHSIFAFKILHKLLVRNKVSPHCDFQID